MLNYRNMPASTRQPPIYRVTNLSAGFATHSVLQELNWELEERETFVVVGGSGCGKTLFLKTLVGLIAPLGGTIEFCGVNLAKMSRAETKTFLESVGMTFQKDGLFDSLTCGENLSFPLKERLKLTSKEREFKVTEALESVGLAGQSHLLVHEMSGGMQKRLGIARALLFSPRVLLYDEPSAGLDPITSRSINDLIIQVRDQFKMSVVLVTSEMAQAKQLGTRIGLLEKGRFLEEGSWSSISRSTNERVARFFSP